MGLIGFIISLFAGLFMLIGLIPFLGWMNWFTTLPLGVLAVIFSAIAVSGRRRSALGTAGLVIGIVVLAVAFLRLWIGWGVI